MWFPSRNKVASKIEGLVQAYVLLNERVGAWHDRLSEMISGGLGNTGIVEMRQWASYSLDTQEKMLETLYEAAVDLNRADFPWRQLLPFVAAAEDLAKSTTGVLDRLDREAAAVTISTRQTFGAGKWGAS